MYAPEAGEAGGFRSPLTTVAPFARSVSTVARPMPDEPPEGSHCLVLHCTMPMWLSIWILCRCGGMGLTCYEYDLAFQAREVLIFNQKPGHSWEFSVCQSENKSIYMV